MTIILLWDLTPLPEREFNDVQAAEKHSKASDIILGNFIGKAPKNYKGYLPVGDLQDRWKSEGLMRG